MTRPEDEPTQPRGDDSMKICEVAGIDVTLVSFMLPVLHELTGAGHQVHCIVEDTGSAARLEEAGFAVHPVLGFRGKGLRALGSALRAMTRIMRRERFDVVHVHTPIAAAIGRIAARAARVPTVVYTVHGFYFHEQMPRIRRIPYVAAEWLLGRLTDGMLVVNDDDASSARRLRLCRGPVDVVSNGVDAGVFHPPAGPGERLRLRGEVGLGGCCADAVVVVAVGRLVEEKGFGDLLRAVGQTGPIHLWLVGSRLASDRDDGIDADLRRAADDPDLSRRVHVLGHRDDVPRLLRAADVFCLPSRREGQSVSVLEAMMSGLPIVGTDIRGIRDQVVHGVNGWLVPVGSVGALAEALDRMASDEALRREMGDASRAAALERYQVGPTARRHAEALLAVARAER